MRSFALALLAPLAILAAAPAQTWGERLGYGPKARVVILHADDAGMCYEANAAIAELLAAGHIQSASAMAPCPWFDAFVTWSRDHPDADVGLHLALTSEWQLYRWGPVSPRRAVPGLLDEDGYLWREVAMVARHADPAEVEREIRAQIERALQRGLKPTHLDSHMGTLFARPDFTEAFLRVAREYGIPALAVEPTPVAVAQLREHGYPVDERLRELLAAYPMPKLDAFLPLPRGDSYQQVREGLFALCRGLRPGITEIVFHPSKLSEGLQHITNSWQQRVWEARLFADPAVARFLAEQGLRTTTWREMMRRWREREPREDNKAKRGGR